METLEEDRRNRRRPQMCNRATPRFNREGDSFSSKIKWPIGRPAQGAMAQAVPGYDFDDWASIPPCSARSMPHDITDDYGDEQRSPTRGDVYGDDDGVSTNTSIMLPRTPPMHRMAAMRRRSMPRSRSITTTPAARARMDTPRRRLPLRAARGGEEEEGEDLEGSMAWALGSATSLTMPPPAFAPPPNETDADQCGACDDDDEQELQEHGDGVSTTTSM